jgi:cytochrome c-type biogenesis protein CcmH/NrfG
VPRGQSRFLLYADDAFEERSSRSAFCAWMMVIRTERRDARRSSPVNGQVMNWM